MEFRSSLTLLNSDTTFLLEKRIQLLVAIERIESIIKATKAHQKILTQLTKMTDFLTRTLKSIQRMVMQISARNQIQGKVEHIEQGKVNSCVFVKLKSGYSLVSVITNSAVESLSLKNDNDVIAIFKSSSVLLTADLTLNISARNKFQGEVIKINTGDVNSEIIIDIGGDTITSVITTEAAKFLDIRIGKKMSAVIKSSDIMIGK